MDSLTDSTKATIVKSLIVISKYLGIHKEFKEKLNDYGIKLHRQNSFDSFLRILNTNNNSNDILQYYQKVCNTLNENEALFLKFLLLTGIRKREGIVSFNKIITLSKDNQLSEYLAITY